MAHLRTLFLSVGSFYFSFVIIIIMNDLCIYLCRLHCKAAVVAINRIVMTGEMGAHRAQKSHRRRGGRKRCTKRLLVWSEQLEKGLTFVDKNLNHVFGYW